MTKGKKKYLIKYKSYFIQTIQTNNKSKEHISILAFYSSVYFYLIITITITMINIVALYKTIDKTCNF
jgi:hypothetical protein